MTHVSDQAQIKRVADGMLCRVLGDEALLIAHKSRAAYALNRVGTVIWSLADGQRMIAEIAAAVGEIVTVHPMLIGNL